MNAQELRIGNVINLGIPPIEDLMQQHTVMAQDIADMDNGLFEKKGIQVVGIRLTPDWLKRLGFTPIEGEKDFYDNPQFPVPFVLRYNGTFAGTAIMTRVIREKDKSPYRTIVSENVRCVHQLQNLFHALTGTELTIK